MQTELGLKAQEVLLRGEAIPEDMAAAMIEEKVNSPEVAHHGMYKLRDNVISAKIDNADIDTLRPEQNCHHFSDLVKCNLVNKNNFFFSSNFTEVCDESVLVQVLAWH